MSAPAGRMGRSVAEGLVESAQRRTSRAAVPALFEADRVSKSLEAERIAKQRAKQERIERVQAKRGRESVAKRQHDSSAAGIARIAKGGAR